MRKRLCQIRISICSLPVLILHHNEFIQGFGFKNNHFCSINNTKNVTQEGGRHFLYFSESEIDYQLTLG